MPDTKQGLLENVEVNIIVEPVIKINGISIASEDKIRLTTSFLDDSPYQMKLSKFNPKITITRKPDHGKIKKIIRNSGDSEHMSYKDITSFTYRELDSGVIYFIARKLPDDVASINDFFEYTLTVKSFQPGQAFVSIEIHKLKSQIADDKNDVNATYEASWPINYLFIIATLAAMTVLVIVLLIFVRCHSSSKGSKNHEKDYPPPLPRPPDFISVNNNRLYSASDCDDSIPVTASSTPLPVLSSIPNCKVIPINSIDSESEEMIDLNNAERYPLQLQNYPYGDENEWSSSGDIANEVNYSSIMQPSTLQRQQRSNPLLRRNQYWV